MPGDMALHCENLSVTYRTRDRGLSALDDVSFTVADHELVCIVGPSGCGKTTLLKLIAGLLEPSSGRVRFDAPPRDSRPRTAMIFQEHGVFPWMNVIENVAFGLEVRGVPKPDREARAAAFLNRVGLAGFERALPHELSMGMRQRVGIARALVNDPEALLLDEPFGSLDAMTKLVLQEELLRIWSESRKQAVFVTHDIEEAVLLGDRVLIMTGRPGRIREDIRVPLARPRDLRDRDHADVLALKQHIWRALEDEVRQGAGIES